MAVTNPPGPENSYSQSMHAQLASTYLRNLSRLDRLPFHRLNDGYAWNTFPMSILVQSALLLPRIISTAPERS